MKLNPLQIAALLKAKPQEITSVIRNHNIPAHKDGFRAGLYDVDEIRSAVESDKTAAAKKENDA